MNSTAAGERRDKALARVQAAFHKWENAAEYEDIFQTLELRAAAEEYIAAQMAVEQGSKA